jgi:hypothetical protein
VATVTASGRRRCGHEVELLLDVRLVRRAARSDKLVGCGCVVETVELEKMTLVAS